MKIRCLLADDNPENLNFLKAICSQQEDLEIVGVFMDGLEFLEKQKGLKYDACFLDINMPGMNGLDLAKLLDNKKVIFVSAKRERAWEAYDIEAVDFVPKPVQPERFEKALQKLRKEFFTVEEGYKFFTTAEGNTRINTADILAIHKCHDPGADKRDKVLVQADGETFLLKNITIESLLEEHLPKGKFLQIFRSTLINIDHPFTKRGHDSLIFQVPTWEKPLELSIGRSYDQEFKDCFPNA